MLFAGYRMGDMPTSGLREFPWDITETEALLINAYDFTKPKYNAVIQNGWQPTRDLAFSDKPILIDSGAYYFLKNTNLTVSPAKILNIEIRSQAHVGVVLDHPFTPEAHDKSRRINRTLRNTEAMYKALQASDEELELMPVLHGHNPEALEGCLKRLRRIAEKYGDGNLPRVGIGSVAPFAQRGDAKRATRIIATVRELLPSAHIHCFSMGSPLLILLAIYAGADTVDSQTWIVSAAFKYAQVPGSYAVRLARRDYSTYHRFRKAIKSFAQQMHDLHGKEQFFVKDWSTGARIDLGSPSVCEDYSRSLTDFKSNENIHNRACHNLWVYNYELRCYREARQEGTLEEFLTGRMSDTRYERTLAWLRKRRAEPM
jgi:tRNA-guanine family transglycosylase